MNKEEQEFAQILKEAANRVLTVAPDPFMRMEFFTARFSRLVSVAEEDTGTDSITVASYYMGLLFHAMNEDHEWLRRVCEDQRGLLKAGEDEANELAFAELKKMYVMPREVKS